MPEALAVCHLYLGLCADGLKTRTNAVLKNFSAKPFGSFNLQMLELLIPKICISVYL